MGPKRRLRRGHRGLSGAEGRKNTVKDQTSKISRTLSIAGLGRGKQEVILFGECDDFFGEFRLGLGFDLALNVAGGGRTALQGGAAFDQCLKV